MVAALVLGTSGAIRGGSSPLSRTNTELMMSHARSAWWLETKSYARTIAPPLPRFTRQPRKKNTPCISDLAGVNFFLKKERVFFFRGSAQEVSGQCGGAKCGLGFATTIFWGKDLAKPRLIFAFAFCPRGGGVWGGIRAGIASNLTRRLNTCIIFSLMLYYRQIPNHRNPKIKET